MKLYDGLGNVVVENLDVMDTFGKRLMGLMFKKSGSIGYGALLFPSNGVHTFFMKFDIGVVYIDKNDMVIRGPETMKRGRIGPIVSGCVKILEYDPLKNDVKLNVGDKIRIGS